MRWAPHSGRHRFAGQPNGALLSIIQRSFYSNGANIAGKPAPGRGDEPWAPMHFIR